jgi:predicted TPR repeat methyltransferase
MDELPEERRVSVAEAMEYALQCLRNGDFEEGEEVCRKILAVAPEHPGAMHYLGVLAHENGRSREALSLIERSIELAPDQADWHSNLGIVRQALDDVDGAVDAYQRAIELQPEHPNAYSNIGVLFKATGHLTEAEEAYRKAIELNPSHADAHHNLAVVLSSTGRSEEAVTCYCRALTLKPHYPEARRALALAYCVLGQRHHAITVCEEWLKDEPDSPIAKHTLAACSGRDVPSRAADDYVQKIFDSFASSFEVKLARLNYRAPELVAEALGQSLAGADKSLDIVDVGCGTGLCGPLLAPYARTLIGVDLSVGMLKHAEEKKTYDRLYQAELTHYLEDNLEAFDVIVSADTLVYFGALEAVVHAAARALRPGGLLIFTVEEATEPEAHDTHQIQPHGRYAHGARYVTRLLKDAGLEPGIGRADLRMEAGLPVAGLVVRGTRPAVGAPAVSGAAMGEHHG